MPYITHFARVRLAEGGVPVSAGELNYVLTRIIDARLAGDLSYTTINEVVGVLECVKLELYRRIATPYEDTKRHENGDVYTTNPNGLPIA